MKKPEGDRTVTESPTKRQGSSIPGKSLSDGAIFEGIEHLSLAGGTDSIGQLVIIPIFATFHLKTCSQAGYLKAASALMASPLCKETMRRLGLTSGQMELVNFSYPGFTGGMPLPNAHIVESVLAMPLESEMRRICARRIKHFHGAHWYDRALICRLRDLDEEHPGLISPLLQPFILAVMQLHEAIDQAEQDDRMVVVTNQDILGALKVDRWYGSSFYRFQSSKPSWNGCLQSMKKEIDALAQTIVREGGSMNYRALADITSEVSKNGPHEKWGMVADVGYAAFHRFDQQITENLRPLYISTKQSDRETTNYAYCLADSSDGSGRSATAFAANHLTLSLGARRIFWNILVQRAMERHFYTAPQKGVERIMTAWRQRYTCDGVWATLAELPPSRPQLTGGALLVRRESEVSTVGGADQPVAAGDAAAFADRPMLRVEPAIVKPHVAGLSKAIQLKRYPAIRDRYLLVTDLLDGVADEGVPEGACRSISLYIELEKRIVWPHGRLWQLVDFVLSLASQPALLLCPEVLHKGYLQISDEKWNNMQIRLTPEAELYPTGVDWRLVADWCVGASPIVPIATDFTHPLYRHSGRDIIWPMSVIDAGIGAYDIRIGVDFIPQGGHAGLSELSSLSQLCCSLARLPQSERSGELEAALAEKLCFEARPYFNVDGRHITEEQWFAAKRTKNDFYRLGCGVEVSGATYQGLTEQYVLRQRVYAKFKKITLAQIWAIHQSSLREGHAHLAPEEYLKQLALRITPLLREIDAKALAPLAEKLLEDRLPDLRKIVRPYQAVGIAWIFLRFNLGFGVCLADEMGLGKTLQAIALLRLYRQPGRASLVVMPKTLLGNWRKELDKFGGGITYGVYPDEQPDAAIDLMLVTYPRLRLDADRLAEISWQMVILDEAQAIKNSDSQTAEAASRLTAAHKIALTGTPVENRAAELWSLIDWLNPGYLGRQHDFTGYTAMARSMAQKHLLLAPLTECLDPIILRRTKKDPRVQLDLPDKIFQDHLCELSDEQAMLYESVIEAILAQESLGLSAFARQGLFLRAILYLKQICIHPDLFYGDQEDTEVVASIDETMTTMTSTLKKSIKNKVQQCFNQRLQATGSTAWLRRSGKLAMLHEHLASWRTQSRGILFFTQYIASAHMLVRMVQEDGDSLASASRFLHGAPLLGPLSRHDSQPQGWRHRSESHRRRSRCPFGPLVEPRRRGSGNRPRASHRPEEHRICPHLDQRCYDREID